MNSVSYDVTRLPSVLTVGRQTETGVMAVRIDCTGWLTFWPGLTLRLFVTAPGGAAAYPAKTHMEGKVLVWDVSSADTMTAGKGTLEVVGEAPGKRKLSAVTETNVLRTTTASTTEPPEQIKTWFEEVQEAAAGGGYYVPYVSNSGQLTWTPSKDGMPFPASVNIRGPVGAPGETPTIETSKTDGVTTVTFRTSQMTTFAQIRDGDTEVTAENISTALGYTPADKAELDELSASFLPDNLCDLSTLVEGGFISRSTGAVKAHNYCGYVRIDVTDVDNLYVYNFRTDIFTNGDVGAIFDSDGNYIAGLYSGNASKHFSLTASGYANKSYALVNLLLSDKTLMVTKEEYLGEVFMPYGTKYLRENVKLYPAADAFAGKTLLVEGDSIAYGAGSGGVGIGEILSEKYGFTLTKKAVSGSTLAVVDGKGCISSRVTSLTTTYDYMILDGGFNDYGNKVPIGAMPTGEYPYTGTPTNDTVVGALQQIFQHMLRNHPTTKLYYFLHHRINRVGVQDLGQGNYDAYVAAIKEVCNKYGVPIISVADNGRMLTYFSEIKAMTLNSDGVHPTEEAYRTFYLPVFEQAMGLR